MSSFGFEFEFEDTKIKFLNSVIKDCVKNKSKFITEDHFKKQMNVTILQLNLNEIIYKRYLIISEEIIHKR
jgi:hypothetical protein